MVAYSVLLLWSFPEAHSTTGASISLAQTDWVTRPPPFACQESREMYLFQTSLFPPPEIGSTPRNKREWIRGRQQHSPTQGSSNFLLVYEPHYEKYRRGKIPTPIPPYFLKFLETSHLLQIPGYREVVFPYLYWGSTGWTSCRRNRWWALFCSLTRL